MATTGPAVATKGRLKGVGYEFCNCKPGCTCNFSGFPSSSGGSCKAFVGNVITEGHCGDIDLSGITCGAAKNPVTGEPHQAAIFLNDGSIWKLGECGVGSFKVDAGDVHLDYRDTNWIPTGVTDRYRISQVAQDPH